MGGYAVVFAVAASLTFAARHAARAQARVPDRRDQGRRPRAACTRRRCRRSAARRCSSGSSSRSAVASQIPQFREMFNGSSEPAGLMLGGRRDVRRRARSTTSGTSRPRPRSPGWCWPGACSRCSASRCCSSACRSRAPTRSCSRPTSRRSSPWSTVVVFANAINLIDGLDGLAAGIVIIAGTALFLYSDRLFNDGFLEGSNIAPLIAVIAVGICVGFLPYNFNPARIFMGDAGALFLGLLMATTTITIGGRADYQYTGTTYFFFAPLFIPIADPRRADRRHRVLSFVRRVAARALVRGRGQGPPAPPAHAPRPRPPPHRRASSGSGPRCSRAWRWSPPTPAGQRQRARADRRARARAAAVRLLLPGPARRPRPIAAEEEAEAGGGRGRGRGRGGAGRRPREPAPRDRQLGSAPTVAAAGFSRASV